MKLFSIKCKARELAGRIDEMLIDTSEKLAPYEIERIGMKLALATAAPIMSAINVEFVAEGTR